MITSRFHPTQLPNLAEPQIPSNNHHSAARPPPHHPTTFIPQKYHSAGIIVIDPPSLPPLIELPSNGILLQADAHNQTNVQDAVDAIVQIDVPVTSAGIAE
jgi:hypothetical protein